MKMRLALLIFCCFQFSFAFAEGKSYKRSGLCFISPNGEQSQAYALDVYNENQTRTGAIFLWGAKKTMNIPYFSTHPEKSIIGMRQITDTKVAVYGEGSITIADLSGNGKTLYTIKKSGNKYVKGAATSDGDYFIASYLLEDGRLGDCIIRLSDGTYKEKTIKYKPKSVDHLYTLNDGIFVQVYRTPEGKYHLIKKSYTKLMENPEQSIFIKDVPYKDIFLRKWFIEAKKYGDRVKWVADIVAFPKESYYKNGAILERQVFESDKLYNWVNVNVLDKGYKNDIPISYYQENLRKSPNDLVLLKEEVFAVLGEGNITIVDVAGNNKEGKKVAKELKSYTLSGRNFITGDVTPDGKYLIAGFIKEEALGTIIINLENWKYQTQRTTYKPDKLLKIVCSDGYFYELYTTPNDKYIVSKKDYRQILENYKESAFLRKTEPIKNASVVADIIYDQGGIVFLAQSNKGKWYFGKLFSTLKGTFWIHNIQMEGRPNGCYFSNIQKNDWSYFIYGGEYSDDRFSDDDDIYPGREVVNCSVETPIFIRANFHGEILNYVEYDSDGDLREKQNEKDPHLMKGVMLNPEGHMLFFYDAEKERYEYHKLFFRGF